MVLVYDERLEDYVEFKPEQLGYIARIFEDTYDYIFRIWYIHNYN